MQIDKDKLQQLMGLSSDEIKKKVSDALNASNFDKKDKENLDKVLKNMSDIKKAIGNIDEESLKKAVNALGVEKMEELKKNISNQNC